MKAAPGDVATGADDDLVSVVMPAYDAASYIARSIDSVLAQTYRSLELIVVDDGSRDATPELLARYAQADPRVVVLRQANAGVAAARNAAIAAARGRFVAFLDSDDWWDERKLELQVAHMHRRGARVSYAAYRRMDTSGRVLSDVRPPARLTHGDMLRSNRIGNLTGMYDRAALHGTFERRGHEDYVFWLRMVREAGEATCVEHDGPLAFYLVRDASLSSNKLRAAGWQWRIYRDVERLGVAKSVFLMLAYAWHAVAKRR